MEENTKVDGTSTEIKDPEAVLAALERAKSDAKKFRLEKEALEKELSEFKSVSQQTQRKLINEKISKKLAELGIQNSDRLMKYIKSEAITLTEDMEIEGLDEQVESLKTDFPELFDPKIIVGGKVNAGSSEPVDTRLSASQLQAKIVLGR